MVVKAKRKRVTPSRAERNGQPIEDPVRIAEHINAREDKAVWKTLEHAHQQGADFVRVRDMLGSRKFRPWYEKHVRFGHDTIYRYIKVNLHWKSVIVPKIGMIKTVSDAIRLIEDQYRKPEREAQEPASEKAKDPVDTGTSCSPHEPGKSVPAEDQEAGQGENRGLSIPPLPNVKSREGAQTASEPPDFWDFHVRITGRERIDKMKSWEERLSVESLGDIYFGAVERQMEGIRVDHND